VIRTFLIGCAVLLVVGCSGTSSEAPQEKGHTEATTDKEQTLASEATARCQGTRTYQKGRVVRGHRFVVTTNDLPDCPKGGLLLGTDEPDKLGGKEGDDEIRGLGASDQIFGGVGKDVIYGGPGDDPILVGDDGDDVIYGGEGDDEEVDGAKGDDVIHGGGGADGLDGAKGKDVAYGGDGNDTINADGDGGQRDKIYCGKGKDEYTADKNDYVSSSCEKKFKPQSIS
jgi:RTX calcium-binding nonapeptide repeat (4 copies)